MVAAGEQSRAADFGEQRRREMAAARIWEVLETVNDPEVPVLSIVDLGIARQVEVGENGIEVVITPTYSGCPAMHAITFDVERALADAGFPEARVRLSLTPAWTTDWLSEAGRQKLQAYGIAPPVRRAAGRRALLGHDPEVACPRCGAATTERISEFGSTACKALYRCRECLEPFDYFKCI